MNPKYVSRSKRVYSIVAIVAPFLISLIALNFLSALSIIPDYWSYISLGIIVFLGIISALFMVLLPPANVELEPLREERQEINRRLKEKSKEDVVDTIRLGLNQLTEYYVINKGQAKSSFVFSLFAIVVGLITIVSGVGIFYLQRTQNLQLTAILSISGTLLEFIGGAYFFVYRKSIDQMNLYFNQLVKMQDTMLAVKLTQDMPNPDRQIDLTEKIVLGLLERSSKIVVDLASPNKRETRGRRSHNSHNQLHETQLEDHE